MPAADPSIENVERATVDLVCENDRSNNVGRACMLGLADG
jgi:hypothetical protein